MPPWGADSFWLYVQANKRSLALLGLVAFLLVAAHGIAGSDAVQACEQEGQTYDAITERSPAFFIRVVSGRCVWRFLDANDKPLMVLVTAVLVVVTWGLALYTARLWRATLKVTRQAKKDAITQGKKTDDAIREANRSANAMEAQVKKTDEIAQRELRAYLGIVEMKLARRQDDGHVYYTIRLKNYGSTPAFSVSASMTRKVLRFPLEDDFQMVEDPDHDDYRSYTTLPPTAEVTVTSSRRDPTIPDDQFRAAIDGNDGTPNAAQVYCFGTIRYRDVFGQEHWAHYCGSFGGNYYRENDGKPTTSNVYNDSSDDPQPGTGGAAPATRKE